ncbi:fimbrial protein [Pusillimonas sp. SM2304]|uniref:fimbrial protein n=1 Tax=Pusillimonas sp. SM2304 TaxID=3073241 RepID=UPI0028740B79|nr:fimbrial protein [Pusillimonas sp. SM2304]MDS1138897.1 fimbrial protein [Pusillimonas sp. SM2304]
MKNRIAASAATVLALAAVNVMAAPGDIIGGGNIEFTGKVSADTCYVLNKGGDAKTILVNMGNVNTADLVNSTVTSPALPQGVDAGSASFDITCSAATGVVMKFAAPASQLVTGNKILKINNGSTGPSLAGGVGIAVYKDRSSTDAFDLSNGELYSGTLAAGQKERVGFAAAYVKTTGDLKAGDANATLPFTIITP